jgi:hypothetical protein
VSLLPGKIRACGRCGETPSQKVLFSRGGVLQCGGVVDYVENLDSKVRYSYGCGCQDYGTRQLAT